MLSLLFSIAFAHAQTWQTRIGGVKEDGAISIIKVTGGGCIIAGFSDYHTDINEPNYSNTSFIKIDINGNAAPIKAIISTDPEPTNRTGQMGSSIKQAHAASGGGYIMTASSIGGGITGLGDWNFELVKLTNALDTEWIHVYGGNITDGLFGKVTIDTTSSGFILTGTSGSFVNPPGTDDFFLMKTDVSGKVILGKTYGTAGDDVLFESDHTKDGGDIMCGYTNIFVEYNTYVIKTSNSGDTLWTKTYKIPHAGTDIYWDVVRSIQQTNDGGYIMAGNVYDTTAKHTDAFLIKIKANGDFDWAKTYDLKPGQNAATSVQQTSDNGFIVAGWTNAVNDSAAAFLMHVNATGAIDWATTYGILNEDNWFNSVVQIKKNGATAGYYAAGETFGSGAGDVYVVKTEKDGACQCHDTQIINKNDIVITSSVISPRIPRTVLKGVKGNVISGNQTDTKIEPFGSSNKCPGGARGATINNSSLPSSSATFNIRHPFHSTH